MNENLHLQEIDLRYQADRQMLIDFLNCHGLRFEDDIDVAYGIFDFDETLLGCGCAAGRILKCFAIHDELRGQNALGSLLSRLMQQRFSIGIYDLIVITRSHNQELFVNCGFTPLVEACGLVLLENRSDGPEQFAKQLIRPEDSGKTIGAAVMNCNPFTNGHRTLIEYASRRCDLLYVFVVEENRSEFPTAVRHQLVTSGVADLENVRVVLSGQYMISAATFPTYFLKSTENAAALQAELDITLFAQRIAPAFHITKRFAGQEPFDPTTAGYNDAMRRIFPNYNIEFCEIPRREQDGEVVSASRVRKLLREKGVCSEVLSLVPETTARYLMTEFRE